MNQGHSVHKKGSDLKPVMGRPTLYGAKMIRRTYQVTVEQDRAISQIAIMSGKSASAVVREGIEIILKPD